MSDTTTNLSELFLLHLRYKETERLESGSNTPLSLDDPHTSWVVFRGSADLFALPIANNKPTGARLHLARLEAGQAAFGIEPDPNVELILVGDAETRLLKVQTQRLRELAFDEELGTQIVELVEMWIRQLSDALLDNLPPKETRRIEAGSNIDLTTGLTVCAKRGVVWLKHLQGHSQFAGYDYLPHLNGKLRWPLSERAWIEATEESQLNVIDTPTYFRESPVWADLAHFHSVILEGLTWELQRRKSADIDRLQRKVSTDTEQIDTALRHLATSFVPQSQEAAEQITENAHIAAVRRVADYLNIEITLPPEHMPQTLDAIVRASRCQSRKVALRGEWWTQDNGALIGRLEGKSLPVALLPTAYGYTIFNPTSQTEKVISAEIAEQLEPFADMLYRTLPTDSLSAWQLIKFGLQGDLRDLRRIFVLGTAAGLLALVVPLAMGRLTDQIIPNSQRGQLWQMGAMLLIIALAMTLFRIVQGLSTLRMQSKLGADLQAAVWDRVLKMPVSFFRDYSAGDLGTRVLGISEIERTLSGTVLGAVLSGIFSIFSFFLLFAYDWQLAFVALGLTAIAVSATVYFGRKQIVYNREIADINGDISSGVLQALGGISKFRVVGAEGRAFSTWAQQFGRSKQLNFHARDTANSLSVFNSSYQFITALVIFAVVIASSQETALTTGEFLAFNTAFLQFFGAILALSTAYVTILRILPLYERARPILETRPEIDAQRTHPGEIHGRIEVSNVSFRYAPDAPLVLRDVSLEANPGEFIAIVGASGSGKSTLLRLLLGFEQASIGSVYYDRQALDDVDVREVRRQLGVVLQNGAITGGDIFTNIVGALPLTIEDAWAAAEMAGLADDIRAMPMKMHTVLSDGGGTLSGGQRQRLLIARAIVNKPRIIYFDEATSALDSQTQAVVSESLENLQATRIVIAHRLSTIMHADRIYVMDAGRVVEQGTYQELMDEEGLFAQLAQRQMA